MSGLIIAVLIFLIIVSTTLRLRVPSSLVFFSLLTGQVLADQMSDDVYYFVGTMFRADGALWVKPMLLILPVILTILFLRGTVSKSRVFMELAPAALTGVAAVILIVPLVPALQNLLTGSQIWGNIVLYQSLIIFTASLASLAASWFSFSKHRK